MRPRVARIFDASWMAWAKSPVISVSAATKRLPKLWPLSASPAAEAMVEEPGQQGFFFAEGHHAVAQVAGGQHVEVLAQAAGGAAVVGDGDHGGQVGDGSRADGGLAGSSDVAPQTAQQRGKARAASDGDHAQGLRRAGLRSGPEEVGEAGAAVLRVRRIQSKPYGISGYSNSVKRGSSTMLWKSLSTRA